jgi:MSHA biogenesis protein MshM
MLALAEELRVAIDVGAEQHQILKLINHALLDFAREGKRVVVCLDEAQAMPLESLEALRLLSNLETEKRKLLQVILFGQPELDDKLSQESVRQLRQRITFQYRLDTLSRKEVEYYVAHRLRVAGYVGQPLFTPRALKLIYGATRGVPRLVNIVAHKCLLVVYGEGGHEVGARHVHMAADDTPSARQLQTLWWRVVPSLAVAVAGGAWFLLQMR